MAFKTERMSIHSRRADIGRLLLALYRVYGDSSPEVEQHAKYLSDVFEENVIYTNKERPTDKDVMYIVNIGGYLLVSEVREFLYAVGLPDSVFNGNNPLDNVDY